MQWTACSVTKSSFTRRVGEETIWRPKGFEPEIRGEYQREQVQLYLQFLNTGLRRQLYQLENICSYAAATKTLGNEQPSAALAVNLLSIDDYSGYYPEVNALARINAVRGFDFVEVPIPRTFVFAISFNF